MNRLTSQAIEVDPTRDQIKFAHAVLLLNWPDPGGTRLKGPTLSLSFGFPVRF